MRRLLLASLLGLFLTHSAHAQNGFTLEQVLSGPFASDLIASPTGGRIAWALNQQGRRNVWGAAAPDFAARQLTHYEKDDGGELSGLVFTKDGNSVVYVRGDGKNSAGKYANPTSDPAGAKQTIWVANWDGGEPRKIDVGNSPRVSARNQLAYQRDGDLWIANLSGDANLAELIVRGKNFPAGWSPDGAHLAFVSERGDHSFIGIYDVAAKRIQFLQPSVDSDSDPVWSLDGKQVAFVWQPAVTRDSPDGYFIQPDRPHPWSIWVADGETGVARQIWQSKDTLPGSYPYMAGDTGGGVLNWAAGNRIVFASEEDGWQHLYAIAATGGAATLLTPGTCEVEQWTFSSDKSSVVFNSNCGDVDRRHLSSVEVAGGEVKRLTSGEGIEWKGVTLSDGQRYAYIGSDAKTPSRVMVSEFGAPGKSRVVAQDTLPKEFPADQLVTPQQVVFKAADGLEIHGQLFLPKNLKAGERRPALIFLHGGPMRQMLLGWHYMYYYSNAYGMNQYLASRGYVVLAINYRSGIGYGRAFREAPGRAGRGATEYQDVVAAGKYLSGRADVNPAKIGLWGGSYGGYLTALGLGRNSDLFAAGVDIHGVHDWPTDNWEGKNISPELTKLAHDSSPVTAVDTWKSPVLFIHGDDDRNVIFSQTVDLVARLRPRGVAIEQLVFPDEVHDFLLHRSWLKGYHATSDFFDRQFQPSAK